MILSDNELDSQNIEEFKLLLNEFIKLKPTKILEIGSMYGWTLEHFIHYAGDDPTVVAVDLPVRNFVGPHDWRVEKQEKNYREVWPQWAKAKNAKLYLVPDASQKPKTLEKVENLFENQLIDFLFIDGDHTYRGVKTDFEMYGRLVRPGGIIAFHDIGENEEGGVFNLWNEIKTSYQHLEFLQDANKQKGIGVLFTK
jgi:predicted O-methyltransferase YrrM